METIICMLINLFRIYLIYRFLNAFFGKSGQSRTKQFLVYGSFFLVNTGMYLLLHMMWINIACNLLGSGASYQIGEGEVLCEQLCLRGHDWLRYHGDAVVYRV